MSPATVKDETQVEFVVPELTISDLLSVIPAHCFKRSALRSSSYVVYDLVVITGLYKLARFADTYNTPEYIQLPHPALHTLVYVATWSLYGFFAGLFAFGLWIIAHECGHQAFSESKNLNNAVGWVLHSGLGVPYHSWRITHAKHHAACCHVDQDQVYIPKTRSEAKLPPLDESKDDIYGQPENVPAEVRSELMEAIGDSPIGASLTVAVYMIAGLHMYLVMNSSGQRRYPWLQSHLKPSSIMFAKHQAGAIVWSDIGIAIWLGLIGGFTYYKGFWEVFRAYLVPFMWVNHWLVLVTFLQHTDPLVPHYRAEGFTFVRGALSTVDRSLLGDCGRLMGWLGAHATHGISETHVLHHVSSKIPHYNAWEASDALRKRLAQAGIHREGAPGGWKEMYRVFRYCKFIEDEGPVVFYKNAQGLAAARPVWAKDDKDASDSGIEVDR